MSEQPEVTFVHDGEWARVGRFPRSLMVYPRDDGSFSIGRNSAPGEWRDVETGFANMQAAIDHAAWMVADRLEAALADRASV